MLRRGRGEITVDSGSDRVNQTVHVSHDRARHNGENPSQYHGACTTTDPKPNTSSSGRLQPRALSEYGLFCGLRVLTMDLTCWFELL